MRADKTASFVDGENVKPEMRKVEQASRIARTEAEQRSTAGDLSPPIGEANIKYEEAGEKPASSVNERLQGEQEKDNIESKGGTKYFNFNKYLRSIIGDPPNDMINPHAHHILFRRGNGKAQQALVIEGQEILRKYGIDPIFGIENLVWAPNRIEGQHDYAALKYVVERLKEIDLLGGDYDDIVQTLNMLGKLAAKRR